MKTLISIVLVWFYIKYVLTLECYWNTDCKYNYFGSKTSYENIRGDIRDSIVKPKECEAVSVWTIMRHGKRHPSETYGQKMKEILNYKDFIASSYKLGNTSLCAQDVENIKNWNIDLAYLNNPVELSSEGYHEMLGIGSRIKKTFPNLLKELQEKDCLFLPAFGGRMQESARAFAKGITNSTMNVENLNNDYTIMAPYSTCGKFQAGVKRNPAVYEQASEYKKSADYTNMVERVEKKLGLNFTFSDENITSAYDLCRYTWDGINNTACPWCAIFSEEDLQVLEYIDDLRHYYRNSYGILQYSKQFGQIPLADLLRNFRLVKAGEGKKIVSYITHATMMDMILVTLNLYKDENPLMGAYRDPNRKWKTSILSTFGTNLIAVLNRCSKYGEDDYNVAFYWNEKPILELCDAGVCSWKEFEGVFKPFSNTTIDFCEFRWTVD